MHEPLITTPTQQAHATATRGNIKAWSIAAALRPDCSTVQYMKGKGVMQHMETTYGTAMRKQTTQDTTTAARYSIAAFSVAATRSKTKAGAMIPRFMQSSCVQNDVWVCLRWACSSGRRSKQPSGNVSTRTMARTQAQAKPSTYNSWPKNIVSASTSWRRARTMPARIVSEVYNT
eukprot:CAMPEP_0117575184 /NCGR_PEP_ID=MMETSP0784-20121206/62065_1 /TAXON_ID=39447 /ORGANISM="" /LENGTH=174 /DNA_ID=CAMNT_0005374225 /DNA_START=82 /DNA_END=606 /DNA_ORIENTATION=-